MHWTIRNVYKTDIAADGIGSGGRMDALEETARKCFGYGRLLSLPVACVSWTVTHEEIFREPREFCKDRSANCGALYLRKLFYLFTCEYCFSHHVTAVFLGLTRFQMLYTGWRGYLISEFSLVWMANIFMSLFNRIRLDIKAENLTIERHARFSARPEPFTRQQK